MWRIAMVLFLVLSWAASAQQGPRISDSLQAAIGRVSPSASVLQAGEVGVQGCGPVPTTPGLVRADFNGDGLEDAAVLLKTYVAKETSIWNGKEYRRRPLSQPMD